MWFYQFSDNNHLFKKISLGPQFGLQIFNSNNTSIPSNNLFILSVASSIEGYWDFLGSFFLNKEWFLKLRISPLGLGEVNLFKINGKTLDTTSYASDSYFSYSLQLESDVLELTNWIRLGAGFSYSSNIITYTRESEETITFTDSAIYLSTKFIL